jgi:hypothetical protein
MHDRYCIQPLLIHIYIYTISIKQGRSIIAKVSDKHTTTSTYVRNNNAQYVMYVLAGEPQIISLFSQQINNHDDVCLQSSYISQLKRLSYLIAILVYINVFAVHVYTSKESFKKCQVSLYTTPTLEYNVFPMN